MRLKFSGLTVEKVSIPVIEAILSLNLYFEMCGSRKYPDSHHGGNWKFQGVGGSEAQEIPEGRGVGP